MCSKTAHSYDFLPNQISWSAITHIIFWDIRRSAIVHTFFGRIRIPVIRTTFDVENVYFIPVLQLIRRQDVQRRLGANKILCHTIYPFLGKIRKIHIAMVYIIAKDYRKYLYLIWLLEKQANTCMQVMLNNYRTTAQLICHSGKSESCCSQYFWNIPIHLLDNFTKKVYFNKLESSIMKLSRGQKEKEIEKSFLFWKKIYFMIISIVILF